ncbi:putative pectinesterase [Medicago truncatula]|uniref:Pectinesterase n=1 Tax=Medicago truncatula TaxID=3880 RepID=G7I4A4_MEDTR|nr:probable pectinesterase/pectinesterase inhibitor 61 isoform X1 [Medicago truncatula]AES58772.1 pectinesterase/pectinesterase inhibitor [Medicago truncatula]RHN76728.1 putative pectinesterase [Medicago truncatula]
MDFDRLGPSDPGGSSRRSTAPLTPSTTSNSSPKSNKKLIMLSILAAVLIIASAISAALITVVRSRASSNNSNLLHSKPTQAISRTCSKTRYPSLCINSLLDFPGSTSASEQELVHISFNMTHRHISKALFASSGLSYTVANPRVRAAYEDCLELMDESMDAIRSSMDSLMTTSSTLSNDDGESRQFSNVAGSTEDVMTWLSAALTNQDTCLEGFEDTSGTVKDQMVGNLKDLSELVSNSLAIFSASGDNDFTGVPIQNKRRLMGMSDISREFPKWLEKRDRRLLSLPVSEIQADIIVSKSGGNGTVKTITEAIKKAPEHSRRRFIIYVRAGRYEENNLKVGKKKTNIMFIGDGRGKTVITGKRSVGDGMTTFHTASFAASGPGFMARDITFENYAGPEKHQAVALRVGSDHAVVYRCNIVGYQDACYVHSNRQFFRECNIYGTVDFIFGNAAVVFQKCNIYARKPMAQQKNTITAQNRKDPNQNTGISIHDCRILPAPDLASSKGSIETYLGRPWKMYSRTVYMLSYMGDHVHPHGWLEWNGDFALKTLYYGEYMNFGPGAAIGQRVKWPGYRVITSTLEANRYTVAQFISGSSWLPSTGVAFLAGLST